MFDTLQAENEGLIKIMMGIDLGGYVGHQSYYEEIKQLYYRVRQCLHFVAPSVINVL